MRDMGQGWWWTPLPPHEALPAAIHALTSMGGLVTQQSPTMISGHVDSGGHVNPLIAALGLLFCLIPGIVYIIVESKTHQHPFSVALSPSSTGTAMFPSAGWATYLVDRLP